MPKMDWKSGYARRILNAARDIRRREPDITWKDLVAQLEPLTVDSKDYPEGSFTPSQLRSAYNHYIKTRDSGPIIRPSDTEKISRAESVVLLISDQHCGKETPSFNTDILADRMDIMVKNVVRVLDIMGKSYDFKKLHILNLGDHIDGDAIFKTHPHHVDRRAAYARAQVKAMTNITVPVVLEPLRNYFGEIVWDGIPGNHGRVSLWTHESNNWDLMYYDYLAMALQGDERIKLNVHEGFYAIPEIEGHGFLMYHGARIRIYQSIPWYGIIQRTMRWAQSMPKPFLAGCYGHFHSSGNLFWLGKEIFLNGTPVTDDDYPMENLGMDGAPKYWLMGVHEERGITWTFKIDLVE